MLGLLWSLRSSLQCLEWRNWTSTTATKRCTMVTDHLSTFGPEAALAAFQPR